MSNIASGVMLIVLRPFHAGDAVQIAGLEGVVESVRIFQTRMHTADNREIILPNSQITASPIINYTARGERRIEIPLAMAFGDDLRACASLLLCDSDRPSEGQGRTCAGSSGYRRGRSHRIGAPARMGARQ